MSKEAMKLALEALKQIDEAMPFPVAKLAQSALRKALASEAIEQPAQQEPVRVPVTDSTYNYAKSLAEAIFKQHFASDEHYSSGRIVWGVNDTVIGILTQIDNMVADMVRKPAQQKPVALKWQQAPVKTQWGDDMVVASVAIDNDHTVCLYCERDQAPKVDAMFAQRKPLTDEQIDDLAEHHGLDCMVYEPFARAIEAAHGIKENT